MENPEARKGREYSRYLENYPFVWNKFEATGFVTLYTEDYPSRGTFQHTLHGWQYPPVDHYMRTFWLAVEDSRLHGSSAKFCLAGRPRHHYTLDYLKQFFLQYSDSHRFAMSLFRELTNVESGPGSHLDGDLVKLLQDLVASGAMENTLVIVMGDHGAQHGTFVAVADDDNDE